MDCQVRRGSIPHAISTLPRSLPRPRDLRRSRRVCACPSRRRRGQTHLPPPPPPPLALAPIHSYPRPLIPLTVSTRSTRDEMPLRRQFRSTYSRLMPFRDASSRDQNARLRRPRVSAWLLEPTEYHAHTLAYRTRARRILRICETALADGALTSRAAVSTTNVRRTASQSRPLESRTTMRVAHWSADRPARQVDRVALATDASRAFLRLRSPVSFTYMNSLINLY